MKFGELKSIGHNIADSMASGIGLMIGIYDMDIFGEAGASSEGYIQVDFLRCQTKGALPSKKLEKAIKLYCDVLDDFCKKHGARRDMFSKLIVKFATDRVRGRYYMVEIEDRNRRVSCETFIGVPGRKFSTRSL